ncbi:MAG: penicillin acylase family protein, partial [Proteobacteria bacterium]|nr:penicillin acylase family protein [Pseudomonadota bacterium]
MWSTTGAYRTSSPATAATPSSSRATTPRATGSGRIDLWRKRGLGRLSASFGPSYVAQDRAARLFLYRGGMAAEWAAYDPQSRQAVEAFAAGVNAYVAEVKAGKKPLPVEFKLTASQPEAWAAEDILRIRSHALVSNVASEVARAQVACKGGLSADKLRRKLEPAHETVAPKGLDPCVVPADVLKDYLLATQQVSFEALAAGGRKAEAKDPQVQLAQAMDAYQSEGSNNWVIAPSRTATGRPILANDPHRAVTVPSLRYIVHMSAPDLDIIGAGEPALPGVSFGHNRQIAWGLTIFYIDQEDLYVYDTPGSGKNGGDAYRYKGKLEPMKLIHETIEVKGEAPRDVTLKFTRHGPVIDEVPGHAFAMRTVWAEPGASGYFGSSRLWRAKSWADFKAGQEHWGVPPLNLVFADAAGDIGWSAAGLTPIRPNWDGLMPVPGDGRYEWAGLRPEAELPNVHNPAEGFFATANEMNLPPGYKTPPSYEWADRSRITRIKEVLAAQPKATLADSMALQTDAHDTLSRRAIALLKPLSSPDPQVRKAIDLLKAWDNDETTGSAAAAIYQVWVAGHLGHTVVQSETPEAVRSLVGSGSLDAVVTWLERPEAAPRRDALLLDSLTAAVSDLERRLGPDMAGWSWGRLHHAEFTPAAAVLADRQTARQMSTGPLQVPGSASSPRAATYSPS